MPWVDEKADRVAGLSAASTPDRRRCAEAASAERHEPDRDDGPKKVETRAVPCDCTENRTTRMTTVSGST